MNRRTVHKISPSQLSSFDQQLWPVLVAITVLSGIAFGAVVTILRGPWMWGSLVLLPLLALLAVFLLFQLDDRKLRRSFQFAVIISLAAHLLVMILASATNIFQNPFEVPERRIAQQKVRTIEISDQRASFVWEKTNSRETPEPDVEPEKEVQPTTDIKPQPVPLKEETTPQVSPQLVRRETPQSTVPRQNPDLSQLRRQTRSVQPRSSQRASETATESIAANSAASAAQPKVEPVENREQADSVQRTADDTTAQRRDSAAPVSPVIEQASETVATSATRRRAVPSQTSVEPIPSPSAASARVRRTTPRLPVASQPAPTNSSTGDVAAASATASPTPSESSADVTRRLTVAEETSPNSLPTAEPRLSPANQFAAATERRRTPTVQPSISNPASDANQPRRSTADAPVATSPVRMEQPARTPESQTTSTEINSKALSISRSTAGAAGIGRSANLERFAGGETSPAQRASDSARRERTMSSPDDNRMLTSSQRSQSQRSKGMTQLPTSTLLADTSAPAKLSGSREPSATTADSSAAQITAASTNHRDETSAERGTAAIDLGPAKIVNEQRSERRSGGGQPEVARLSPDLTRRSREQSSVQPTLTADAGPQLASPRSLSSSPPAAMNVSPAAEANLETRSGADNPETFQLAAATIGGAPTNRGVAELNNQLSAGRQRSTDGRESATFASEDEPVEASDAPGESRSRIAQAPVTRLDPGFGIANNTGRSNTDAETRGPGEVTATDVEVVQRATSEDPGSGLERGLAEDGTDSAGAVAPVQSAASRRAVTASAGDGDLADLETPAMGSVPSQRSTQQRPRPSMDAMGLAQNLTDQKGPAPTTDQMAVEATAVEIERADDGGQDPIAGLALDVDAIEGPAGLSDRPDEMIGVLARPASLESDQIMPDLNSRFRNREFGGTPAMNPDAVLAQEAFRNRSPSTFSRISEPTTEASIQLGLEFLARHQLPDGSWSLTGFDQEAPQKLTQLDSDTAATGLALLAFQGAGYNHREYKYARQLDLALQWLIEHQSEDGSLYVPSDEKSNSACRLYSHGIAALALTEAYGMTRDPSLKEPAQKALDYIVNCQDPRKGGWRYFDQPGKQSADTSVSGWMMMAIQSGQLAELEIDPAALDGIDDWLDVAADPEDESKFRYNPYLVDAKGVSRLPGRNPSVAMTSVGLLMRVYRGWKKDDPRLLAGADHLLATQLPSDSTPLVRDTYYWYYATQVFRHIGGSRWEQWNDKLRPLLTRSQEKTGELAGSWHPYRPVPDRWGPFGGRIYVTTMNLLSLEVRHRLLPLYQPQEPPLKVLGIIERGDAYVFNTGPPAATAFPATMLDTPTTPTNLAPLLNEPNVTDLAVAASHVTIAAPKTPGAGDTIPSIQLPDSSGHAGVAYRSTEALTDTLGAAPSDRPELELFMVSRSQTADSIESTSRISSPIDFRSLPEAETRDWLLPTSGTDSQIRRQSQRHFKPSLTSTNASQALAVAMSPAPLDPFRRSEVEFDPVRDSIPESAGSSVTPVRELETTEFDRARLAQISNLTKMARKDQPIPSRTRPAMSAPTWNPAAETLENRVPRTESRGMPRFGTPGDVSLAMTGDHSETEPSNPGRNALDRNEVNLNSMWDNVDASSFADLTNRSHVRIDLPVADLVSQAPGLDPSIVGQQSMAERTLPIAQPQSPYLDPFVVSRTSRSLVPESALAISIRPSVLSGPTGNALGSDADRLSNDNRSWPTPLKGERTAINSDPIRDASPASRVADSLAPRMASADRDTPASMASRQEGPMAKMRDNNLIANRMRSNGRLPILSLPAVSADPPVASSGRGRLLSGVAAVRRMVQNRPVLLPMARRPRYGSISGTVLLDGKTLPQARVEFIPMESQATRIAATTNSTGQFTISQANTPDGKGLQAGRYRVAITTYRESPNENVIDLLEQVPEKYNSQTTLEITIEADQTNRKQWKLTTQ